MANEIKAEAILQVEKGSFLWSRSLSGLQATMTGDAFAGGVVSVGTSKESLALGDVSTPGWVLIKNLDDEHFVAVGADADSPFLKLKAGEFALFRMAGATLSAKADTAACLVEYYVIED
jgi:hypothetical protein